MAALEPDTPGLIAWCPSVTPPPKAVRRIRPARMEDAGAVVAGRADSAATPGSSSDTGAESGMDRVSGRGALPQWHPFALGGPPSRKSTAVSRQSDAGMPPRATGATPLN